MLMNLNIIRWVEESGQRNTVMTITELLEEGNNADASWKGISHDVIIKALLELQKTKKAEVFDDQDGVKFF